MRKWTQVKRQKRDVTGRNDRAAWRIVATRGWWHLRRWSEVEVRCEVPSAQALTPKAP